MGHPFSKRHKKKKIIAIHVERSQQAARKTTENPNRRKIQRVSKIWTRGHQSEVQETKEDDTVEEGRKKGVYLIEHDPRIYYVSRPRTRPMNKLRLGFNDKLDPKLK